MTSEVSSIIITTKTPISVSPDIATLTDGEYNYYFNPCSGDSGSTTITCLKMNTSNFPTGTYRLKLLTKDDNNLFSVENMTNNEISYKTAYLALGTTTSPQTITTDSPSFTITLAEGEGDIPTFYVGNNKDKQVACQAASATELSCTAGDSIMEVHDTNEKELYYYTSPCDEELTPSGIKIIKTSSTSQDTPAKTQITISRISLSSSDDSQCAETANKFYLTVSAAPSGQLSGALTYGKESETTITFTCPSRESPLVCTLDTPLSVGSYTLKTIQTASAESEELIYTDIASTALKIDTLTSAITSAEQTLTIGAGNTSFTILLGDTTKSLPLFFIDSEDKPITCTRKAGDEAATIECATTDETMPPDGTTEHNILYKGFCMTEAQPTGVKVIKNTNTPVQVNTITLSKISLSSTKDTVCTSSGITQVIFTADKTATGSISGTIISRTDGTKIIDFNQCDVEGTTIICTAENVSPDRYSVSSLTSDAEGETININTIISTILTYAKTLGTMPHLKK